MRRAIFYSFMLTSITSLGQFSFSLALNVDNLKEQQLVTENSRLMQDELLLEANIIADELLKLKPESSNYNYRKGYAVLYALQNYELAKKHLEKAILYTRRNYDAYSKNEQAAPTDAFYHLAFCEHNLGNYTVSEQLYQKFKSDSRKESELLKSIDLKLIQVNNAKKQTINPNSSATSLDEINTIYNDYCPIITSDGELLQFTSRRKIVENMEFGRKYPDNTYSAKILNDSSSEIEHIPFGHKDKNESLVFTSMNQRFLIYYSDSEGNGDLFHKNLSENSYTYPIVNTEFWETHAFITNDGKTFYFVSDKLGGFGGRDIYKCNLNDGKWSDPINLGPTINSKYDEDAPFLSIDGKTLYFSSNGEKSMGGFDIFASQLTNGEWTQPINLGTPYNSPSDDVFYVTTSDGKTAFFSSNRKESKGRLDLYTIPALPIPNSQIAVFKGWIKTKDGKVLPEDVALFLTLKCLDCENTSENALSLYPSLSNGQIIHALEPCKSYAVYFKNGNEIFDQFEFSTLCDLSYQEISREFIYDVNAGKFLTPEKEIEIKPIFAKINFRVLFDYNKTTVGNTDPDFVAAIQTIEKQILDGKESMVLSIYSSASKVPTKKFGNNQRLADKRAKDMKDLLESVIENNNILKGKVTVKIVESSVNGPEYDKDPKNKDKYKPFQFLSFEAQ